MEILELIYFLELIIRVKIIENMHKLINICNIIFFLEVKKVGSTKKLLDIIKSSFHFPPRFNNKKQKNITK